MEKRVIIAGCRTYTNYEQAREYIDFCLQDIRNEHSIIIVSGACCGADLLGERYARENGFKIERYPADWNRYGNSAGPIRNRQMASVGDYLICFWDGTSRGTRSMINCAKEKGLPVKVKYI